jgi:hypothetical protein
MQNIVFTPVDCSGKCVDSCGLSWSGETPQEQSDEEAQRQPQGRIAYEKDGNWSFFFLPAESEAPGTKSTALFNRIISLY